MSLQWIAENFERTQVALLFLLVGFAWFRFLKPDGGKSNFKRREADRAEFAANTGQKNSDSDLANAKLKRPQALPGIRLEGEAHEILNVSALATEEEIMRAYKDAIKRYHPDRIPGADAEKAQFYQQVSAKLNQAKEELMKRAKART